MDYLTTISKKGQITIPKELREKLGFNQFSKVVVELEKGGKAVRIRPVTDIVDIAGQFSLGRKQSVLEARKEMEKSYGQS